MSELPPAARARLERVLADAELALSAATRLTPTYHSHTLTTGDVYIGIEDHGAAERLRVALVAAVAIMPIIGALEWPATDRRTKVAVWLNQVRRQCGIDRVRFRAELRKQSAWLAFQDQLSKAERTDVRPLSQRLEALRLEAQLTQAELATLTAIPLRTVERHLHGAPEPKRFDLLKKYATALTTALNRDIQLKQPLPLRASRPRKKSVGKKPGTSR